METLRMIGESFIGMKISEFLRIVDNSGGWLLYLVEGASFLGVMLAIASILYLGE